jgi:hypothetical protein
MHSLRIIIGDQTPYPDIKVLIAWSEHAQIQDSEFTLSEVNSAELNDEQLGQKTKFTFRFMHRDHLGTQELGFVMVEDAQSAFLYIETRFVNAFVPFPMPSGSHIPFLLAEAFASISKKLEDQPILTPPIQST